MPLAIDAVMPEGVEQVECGPMHGRLTAAIDAVMPEGVEQFSAYAPATLASSRSTP